MHSPTIRRLLALLVLFIGACAHAPDAIQDPEASVAHAFTIQPVRDAPAVEALMAREREALGGDALEALTTRTMHGTAEYRGINQHEVASIDMWWQAPDRFLEQIQAPFGLITRGFDGRVGWVSHPQGGTRRVSAVEQLELERERALYQPSLMRDLYTAYRIEGQARIDDRLTWVIAATSRQGRLERFFLDTMTALPVRVDVWEEGPEAERVEGEAYLAHIYLADYRRVEGLQVPFMIRRVRPNSSMQFRFDRAELDVAVDEAKFSSPQGL